MNPRDLPRHEWIGLDVKVVKADNPSLVGLTGTVIDETKNMLTLDCNGTEKRIEKAKVTMNVTLNGHTYEVDGKILVGRPEDRVKKVRRLP